MVLQENKDKLAEYKRKYRQENKEKAAKHKRKYRQFIREEKQFAASAMVVISCCVVMVFSILRFVLLLPSFLRLRQIVFLRV